MLNRKLRIHAPAIYYFDMVRRCHSIREAARRVGRDVKAVHADLTALLNAGVLERNEQGGVVFPYDAVKVEFLLEAA